MKTLLNLIVSFFKKFFIKEKEESIVTYPDWNPVNTNVDPVEWVVENQTSDPEKFCLKVTYREKYGSELVVYCMALFRNDTTKQYKMVAPWMISKIIEMSNLTGIEVNEVAKSEAQL